VKIAIYITVYVLGVALAVFAAFSGSIGPEPARSAVGEALSTVYYPYFMLFCESLDMMGFVIAIALSGIPFVVLVWLWFRGVSAQKNDEEMIESTPGD
jgi:hypothetical protein